MSEFALLSTRTDMSTIRIFIGSEKPGSQKSDLQELKTGLASIANRRPVEKIVGVFTIHARFGLFVALAVRAWCSGRRIKMKASFVEV